MSVHLLTTAGKLVLAIVALAAMAACVPIGSLSPAYSGNDLVFEAGLVGTWQDADAHDTWIFKQVGKNYELVYTDAESTSDAKHSAKFTAKLVRLADTLFLDIAANGDEAAANEAYGAALLPIHLIARVRIDGNELRLAFIDDDVEPGLLKDVAHARLGADDGRLVFTASTADLQAFLARHASDDALWEKASQTLHRVPAPQAPCQ